jgi:glucose/arabinose dehydrogenase
MEQPFLFWVPSIMPGGLAVYTADKFPTWRGHIFIGGLQTRQLHHVILNNRGLPTRRESLLTELGQRIRDVRQGPDGFMYALTDQSAGALLKLELPQKRRLARGRPVARGCCRRSSPT